MTVPGKGGAPSKYNSIEELDNKIQEYFDSGVKEENYIVKDNGSEKIVKRKVYTITGLALYLGFASRQSFYDYEDRGEFSYSIKRARLFIESEYEALLQSKFATGAIFALKNFGWKDKQEIENTGNSTCLVKFEK